MRNFYLFLLFLLFWSGGMNNAKAQYMTVKLQDGTEETMEITSLRDLQFQDSTFYVNYFRGESDSYPLSTVSTLYFNMYLTAAQEYSLGEEPEISVYPNPVSDILYIENAETNSTYVSVYRMDGVLISKKLVTSDNFAVDVSAFSQGMFLIRVEDQVFKIVKR